MNVVFIQFPYAFTADGKRLNIKEVDGKYLVKGMTNDSECVSGVCPIK